MLIALVATAARMDPSGYALLAAALIPGAAVGAVLASRVQMTSMPQLVAILHSFVGAAAVLVGIATYLGVGTALLAFVYALWVVFKALRWGDPVAGWPTMMAVILLLGGVQLMALGLIGEYLGRLYAEAKQRPLYLVDAWRPGAGLSSEPSLEPGDVHAHRPATARGESA